MLSKRRMFVLAVIAMLMTGLAFLPSAAERATPAVPDDGKLRVIVFGAHPDDCEIDAGGTSGLWTARGDHVKFVSVTNGDIGHWKTAGGPLAHRRRDEAQRADEILGVASQVLDIHDGELMPTLENRRILLRLMREWKADIVIGPRPWDYHPDHRYTGVLVEDAAYMVTVPFFCPDTPHLARNPVFLYSQDSFQRPCPFRPDVVVAIDPAIEKKLDSLAAMESQFLEGGVEGSEASIPKDEAARKTGQERVRSYFRGRFAAAADTYRGKLIELYGEEKGKRARYAEAFEVCEYGRTPSPEELRKLFPIEAF
jgi:LmbE family N-acetylglucosaminyl deacetylase